MRPTVKQQVLGQGEDILKEAFTSAALLADLLVRAIDQMQHGMD